MKPDCLTPLAMMSFAWFERLAHIASHHRGRCRRTLWSRASHCPVSQCALIPQLPVVKDNGELLLWRGRSGRGGVPPVPSTGEHALLTSRCRVLAGQLEFLEAAQQPGLTRRRFRPASLARFRERERHVDVPRDARPAHDDGGRDRSRMSRTAVPCAPPRSAVCTRPLAAVDCETAVRQVAERARALSGAARTHTQQVAGLLVGLRPPAV
jgi:hypothetical protein